MPTHLPETLITILSCVTFGLAFFALIFGFHGNYRLYRVRNEQFMQARQFAVQFGTNFSLLMSIVATCCALQARLSSSSISILTYSKEDNRSQKSDIILICLGDILLISCYSIFVCFLLTTSWLIYYREKWQFYSLKEQWTSIIRRDTVSENWFIINNQRFGNRRFVFKLVGSYHFGSILCSITGILCHHMDVLPRTVSALIAALPMLFSIGCYVWINVQTHKMRLVDDVWFVHWERIIIAKLLTVFIFLYLIQQLVIALFVDTDDLLCSFVFAPCFVTVTYAIHYVSTYGIFFKNNSALEKSKRTDSNDPKTVQQLANINHSAHLQRRYPPHAAANDPVGNINDSATPSSACDPRASPMATGRVTVRPTRRPHARETSVQRESSHGDFTRIPPSKISKSPLRMIPADSIYTARRPTGTTGGSGSAEAPNSRSSPMTNRSSPVTKSVVQESTRNTKSNKLQSPQRPMTFSKLLGKGDSLHLFMIHLSKEYNMECLLAYIEMTQYQSYALQSGHIHLDEGSYYLVPLSDSVPQSSIVQYGNDSEQPRDEIAALKMKGRDLFIKYLCPGCEYECNISGKLRSRAVRMLRDKATLLENKEVTVENVFLLFEDVKSELSRFLHPSFYAFKHTDHWKFVVDLYAFNESTTSPVPIRTDNDNNNFKQATSSCTRSVLDCLCC